LQLSKSPISFEFAREMVGHPPPGLRDLFPDRPNLWIVGTRGFCVRLFRLCSEALEPFPLVGGRFEINAAAS
jgi:hypothetical protein